MGNCSVCQEEDCKAFLFMPSDKFVFLCHKHVQRRLNSDSSIPIIDWVEKEKDNHKAQMVLLNITEKLEKII